MRSSIAGNVLALLAIASSALAAPPNDMSPVLRRQVEAEFAGLVMRSATDLQTFTGALSGIKAPPITNSGDSTRPFEVEGSTFTDFTGAGERSCSDQFQGCQKAANSNKQFTVSQCDSQQQQCNSAQSSATQQNFQAFTSSNADFTFICDP